jgi:hypothetical protein
MQRHVTAARVEFDPCPAAEWPNGRSLVAVIGNEL